MPADKSPFFAAIERVASFPHVMAAIRAAVADRAATPPSIARSVERDVAFASRLLRIVNAPEIGLIRPCASVTHAVSLVGMRRIGMLAEAAASRATMERCAAVSPEISARATIESSIARALATANGAPPEQAFTAALLSNVGTVAMLATDASYRALRDATPPDQDLLTAERERFGFDHPELGGDILKRWNMPAPIPDVVALSRDLAKAAEAGRDVERLVAIVQCTRVLQNAVAKGEEIPSPDVLAGLVADPAFAVLGLDAERLAGQWPALRNALRSESNELMREIASEDAPSRQPGRSPAKGSAARTGIILAAVLVPSALAIVAFLQQ